MLLETIVQVTTLCRLGRARAHSWIISGALFSLSARFYIYLCVVGSVARVGTCALNALKCIRTEQSPSRRFYDGIWPWPRIERCSDSVEGKGKMSLFSRFLSASANTRANDTWILVNGSAEKWISVARRIHKIIFIFLCILTRQLTIIFSRFSFMSADSERAREMRTKVSIGCNWKLNLWCDDVEVLEHTVFLWPFNWRENVRI